MSVCLCVREKQCACVCACTDDIHFFHEESSCTGRHNARQMVPKTYSPRQSMRSYTEKKYVYNNVHNIMISFYLQLSIIKTARILRMIRKIDFWQTRTSRHGIELIDRKNSDWMYILIQHVVCKSNTNVVYY